MYRWLGSLTDELAPLPQYWVECLREPDRQARPSSIPVQAVRGTRYGIGGLRRQVAELLEAEEGTRNAALNKSAFAMGQLVGAGMLDAGGAAGHRAGGGAAAGAVPGTDRGPAGRRIVGWENSAEIEIYYTDSVQGGDRGSLQHFLGSVPRPAVVNHQCAPASGTEPVPQ